MGLDSGGKLCWKIFPYMLYTVRLNALSAFSQSLLNRQAVNTHTSTKTDFLLAFIVCGVGPRCFCSCLFVFWVRRVWKSLRSIPRHKDYIVGVFFVFHYSWISKIFVLTKKKSIMSHSPGERYLPWVDDTYTVVHINWQYKKNKIQFKLYLITKDQLQCGYQWFKIQQIKSGKSHTHTYIAPIL